MLFCFHRHRDTLQRALRAAVAAHRSDIVRDLLGRQGEALFAGGLAGLSARAVADTLSMLPIDQREGVVSCLSRHVRAPYLRQAALSSRGKAAISRPLQGLRVWGAQP